MKEEIAAYLTVQAMLKIKLENLEKVFLPKFTELLDKREMKEAEALAASLPVCSLRMKAYGMLQLKRLQNKIKEGDRYERPRNSRTN